MLNEHKTPQPSQTSQPPTTHQPHHKLLFGKSNYILLIIGLVMILGGFAIMSLETQLYGFGTLGLSVGPFVALAGFVLEIFAIFFKKNI